MWQPCLVLFVGVMSLEIALLQSKNRIRIREWQLQDERSDSDKMVSASGYPISRLGKITRTSTHPQSDGDIFFPGQNTEALAHGMRGQASISDFGRFGEGPGIFACSDPYQESTGVPSSCIQVTGCQNHQAPSQRTRPARPAASLQVPSPGSVFLERLRDGSTIGSPPDRFDREIWPCKNDKKCRTTTAHGTSSLRKI